MTANNSDTENKKDEKPSKSKESKDTNEKSQQVKEKSKTPEDAVAAESESVALQPPQTPTEKDSTESKATAGEDKQRLRKSTRATRFKSKTTVAASTNSSTNGNGSGNTTSNKSQTKGRNRRSLFKKTPYKTPLAQATTHVVESVFYKGSYLQVGDIVSLVDSEDSVYYAQIRGLLVDDYCEKSAFLTWLIPTQESPDPRDGFDAATYLIGPDEELSRKLSCLEFVMHAPSDYYLDRSTPFPLPDSMETDTKPGGYIWTTLPEYQRNKNAD